MVKICFVFTALLIFQSLSAQEAQGNDSCFIGYTTQSRLIRLYWKDEHNKIVGSFSQLKSWLGSKHQTLQFAMNGGMYKPDHSPVGLYTQEGKIISPLDTAQGSGNFYLLPNGVFYITKSKVAGVISTKKFDTTNVWYATQSGPMLIIDGAIHPAFTKGSSNKAIRNGVGTLPDGQVVFAIAREPVNFYDFADYFKRLGCRNALYLDGFVSRMYLPQKQLFQTDGDFGVIIGIATDKK